MFILSCLSRKPGLSVGISEGTKLKGKREKKRKREREGHRKRQKFNFSFEMEKVIITRELKRGREDDRW